MEDNIIKKQNEVIISLIGRYIFPEKKLQEIIGKSKRNPQAYFRGYNACDGKNSVTQIAKIIGVSQPTLTPIIKEWEKLGIIYEIESIRGKTYIKLYNLNLPKESKKRDNQTKDKEVKNEEGIKRSSIGENSQTNGLNDPDDVEESTDTITEKNHD